MPFPSHGVASAAQKGKPVLTALSRPPPGYRAQRKKEQLSLRKPLRVLFPFVLGLCPQARFGAQPNEARRLARRSACFFFPYKRKNVGANAPLCQEKNPFRSAERKKAKDVSRETSFAFFRSAERNGFFSWQRGAFAPTFFLL